MGEDDTWEWKLLNTGNDTSVRSDFEVGKDNEMSGGLHVRLTFTFTAGGLAAPLYVSVSGLTPEELSPKLLATKVSLPYFYLISILYSPGNEK